MDPQNQENHQELSRARQSARNRAKLEGRNFAIWQGGSGVLRIQPQGWEPEPHNFELIEVVDPAGKSFKGDGVTPLPQEAQGAKTPTVPSNPTPTTGATPPVQPPAATNPNVPPKT